MEGPLSGRARMTSFGEAAPKGFVDFEGWAGAARLNGAVSITGT